MRLVIVVLAVVAAVVAVSAANFVLLDYGRTTNDRVGKLTPRMVGTIGNTAGGSSTVPVRSPGTDDDDHEMEEPDEDD